MVKGCWTGSQDSDGQMKDNLSKPPLCSVGVTPGPPTPVVHDVGETVGSPICSAPTGVFSKAPGDTRAQLKTLLKCQGGNKQVL